VKRINFLWLFFDPYLRGCPFELEDFQSQALQRTDSLAPELKKWAKAERKALQEQKQQALEEIHRFLAKTQAEVFSLQGIQGVVVMENKMSHV
jgi:hypothetical protein